MVPQAERIVPSFEFMNLKLFHRLGWLCVAGLIWALPARGADVVINEIMYRPASNDPREEFIELYNSGSLPVDLSGWRFTKGISFTFPELTILAAGSYLVVSADPAFFQTIYPAVTSVAGPWRGSLSNNGEEVSLANAAGQKIDSIRYATQGDWAIRKKGPLDYKHRGWIWFAEHNGKGPSLERISAQMPNEGQNWGSSKPSRGSPGARNSIARANIAPLILKAAHAPAIPKPSDIPIVTAKIVDESSAGLTVTVFFRVDGTKAFSYERMADDGKHGDGQAKDGVFGVSLPAHSSGRIMEFYLEAIDDQGNRRTFPAPVESGEQEANLLFQVVSGSYTGAQPLYRLIMTQAERDELDFLSSRFDDTLSNAQMNGTFISVDESGTEVRYLVGLRNRGHGTRIKVPHNFRVNFRNDQHWHGVEALELNTQYTHAQVLGNNLFQHAGIAAANVWPAQVRVNNDNLAKAGSPQFGSYAALEALNSDFLENHFPDDSGGNLYRGVQSLFPATEQADLTYLGENPNLYRENYSKQNNTTEDDWSDLIDLIRVLSAQTPELIFRQEVYRVLNVDELMRYLALNALIENEETTINTGVGDDYAFYRGEKDPRFIFLPYDHDTILNVGDDPGSATAGLLRFTKIPALKRLYNTPDFQPLFYWHLKDLIDTTFSAPVLNALVDELLGSWVPATERTKIKNFATKRREWVSSQVPAVIRPAISTQPISVAAREGDPATLSVVAVGTGPLTFQWARNGFPISGANSAVLPLLATVGQAGIYTVTVMNGAGSITSLPASVTVTASSADSDADGLPDDWENSNGLNPFSPDAAGDPDNDGMTNLQEFLSGTQPMNSQSRLSLQAAKLSNTRVSLSFTTLPGHSYTVQYRDAVESGAWAKLNDFAAGDTPQELRFTDDRPAGAGPRFYRLVTPQQP